MARPRIGLTQRVEDLADRGERRDCLDQAWTALLDSLGFLPVPLPNTPADPRAYLDAMALDGLILTGGNDLTVLRQPENPAPERDHFERACLAYSRECHLPVLGVCRGLQMMAVESGALLRRIENHVARHHRLSVERPEALPLGKDPTVNSFHDYGLEPGDLPGNWRVVATAPDGTVEAMVHESFPQWAIMWHPERAPERLADRELLRRRFSPTRGAPKP